MAFCECRIMVIMSASQAENGGSIPLTRSKIWYNIYISNKDMPPKVIQPFLWFSDLNKINLKDDKDRIILNVLNIGTKKATDWLFDFYGKPTIKKTVINLGGKGELSDKSLNYWTLVLKIDSKKIIKTRF